MQEGAGPQAMVSSMLLLLPSLCPSPCHTLTFTRCYGVFRTSVPSVLNTSSLPLAPIPLILSWTVTLSEKAA